MPPPRQPLVPLCLNGISAGSEAAIRPILKSQLIEACGRAPILGSLLRAGVRRYPEGSVVTIKSGVAAGMRWRRYHRFVNAYWLGSFELDVQLVLRRLLRPGDVFYDVGANAGFFTVLGGKLVGPRGKVFAFEPVPDNAEVAREQIELNRLSWCEVVPVAVGAHSGQRTLSHVPGKGAMAHLGSKRIDGELEISVATVTLDSFVADHTLPALVKVDVEGSELEVLRGATVTIKRGTCVVLELHNAAVAGEVVEILGGAGYAFESLQGARPTHPAEHVRLVARLNPTWP